MTMILTIFIALLIPLVFIPLIMRIFVSRIVLALIKRKYLPQFIKNLHEGWQTEQDKKAIQAIIALAYEKLKYHFIITFNLKADLEAILLCIQNIYVPDSKPKKIRLNFSIKKLIYCCLLGFCDLYREYSEQKWFKLIKNIRLIWFWRFSVLNRQISDYFTHIPFLEKLRKMRLLGPVIRLLLIPVLGVPFLIWYIVKSISFSIFYEGFLRFFYGLFLLKIGYYVIYLYGRENTIINKRVAKIPKNKIESISKEIDNIISAAFQSEKSEHFAQAVTAYQILLKEVGLDEDNNLNRNDLKNEIAYSQVLKANILKFFKNLLINSKEAYKKQNPFKSYQNQDKQQLLKLYRVIGGIYFPKAKEPGLMLRITEIIEIGYMASLLLLNYFFTKPGIETLSASLSLELILKVKNITENDQIRNLFTNISSSYKYVSILKKFYQIIKVAQGIASPYQLVFNLSSSIILQYMQKSFKQYIFHKTGRLFLYSLEKNFFKHRSKINSLLWDSN